ncbi:CobD/CbiB family cobalamin biosynthesis protein [Halorubrum lipolyticum]|nr:CobD/CbiB family cobalamin biosynthesis protein [Halorubrum lipolyticum]
MATASLLGPASAFRPALAPLAALAIAVALDLALAEPPARVHPVALFGSIVGRFDRSWSHPRSVGVAVAVGLPLGAAAIAGGIVAVAAVPTASPVLPVLLAGALLFTAVSLRMLLATTAEVVALTETDPDAARRSVRALAGRDATELSPADLRSAAVESAAENLADGFVAPLSGFALGATVGLAAAPTVGVAGAETALPLAAGVAGAVWVKAVNTLDSMLGYRSKPVGWASARLDDAAMFLPARATAGCLAVAAGSLDALRRAASWARVPESPNSGWPMATAAAALDARLEKPGHYVLNPDAGPPGVVDAERAVRLVGVAAGVAVALAAGWLAAVGWVTATWPLAAGRLPATAGVVGWL